MSTGLTPAWKENVRRLVNARWIAFAFPLSVILAVAGLYELFEWQFAVLGDPEAGHAVLGSQGDVWDAQKDILADGLGAVFALIVFAMLNRDPVRDERD